MNNRIFPSLVLLLILILSTADCLGQTEKPTGKLDYIVLEVQIGDQKKRIEKIPFKEKMTVLDALKAAQKMKKISFKFRGNGPTTFVTEIDKKKNEGARGDNWIFRVNKKLGKKSCGVIGVKPGDTVNWSFGKYRP